MTIRTIRSCNLLSKIRTQEPKLVISKQTQDTHTYVRIANKGDKRVLFYGRMPTNKRKRNELENKHFEIITIIDP